MSVATLAVRTLRSARYSPMSLMLLGVLALSGCSMVPEYRQPELPVAAQWDGTPDSQSAPGGQWWREFHSVELDSLIARGLASNYTLKAAVSRIDEARASAQVVGAGQYPALNLGGNFQRQNNYGTTAKRSVFAEATYEVDFWGKQRALVGENGSGKTTLIKLLTRLYRPDQGRILLDGSDLQSWSEDALRRRIGVIFQDYIRYQFPVGENLGVGDIDAFKDETRWREAASQGMAAEFIERLDQGYAT